MDGQITIITSEATGDDEAIIKPKLNASLVTTSSIGSQIQLDSLPSAISSINLKEDDFSKVNWSPKLDIEWDLGTCETNLKKKLKYKDFGQTVDTSKKYELIKNRSPLDVVQNENVEGTTYALKYYTDNNDSTNAIMTPQLYSGTSQISNSKTIDSVTINDVPYEADSKISISLTSGNPATVVLNASNQIIDSTVKEVGVRVEYTLNGVRSGIVKRTKNIVGKNGTFTFTFKNIPNEVTDSGVSTNIKYSAYYIDVNNNEYSL